jgi:quinol-cytochrome oxidoreductase complex cytochrome b subunit
MRLSRIPVIKTITDHIITYPTPSTINYFWGFGSLAGLCLVIQLISGIILSFHYSPEITLAFSSVEHIMRDVNGGWLIRYIHANGASFFFLIIYIHMARGLYFQSYKNTTLWYTGILLFFLTMATAFLGYVLPWGQMSFWGATVITNLFTAIPYVGDSVAMWLWGGFSVSNATLNRFFSLHFVLPFVIAGASLLHLAVLHVKGSTAPTQLTLNLDYVKFYPYFVTKDLLGLLVLLIVFGTFVCFFPNKLGHFDNYIRANPLVTPSHIVPEWYFLPFYAILRSIPNKLLGVLAMALSILILLTCSWHVTHASRFNVLFKNFFWAFCVNFLFLGWLGAKVVEQPYIILAQLSTIFYFLYFVGFLPLLNYFDKEDGV